MAVSPDTKPGRRHFRFSLDFSFRSVVTIRGRSPQMSAKTFYLLSLLCASRLLIANSVDNNAASPARTAVTSRIPRESVASKGIASIGYSKRLHILEIEFVNGAVYRYLQVAPSVHRDLMAADSKARYYDANIKGNYPSVRVRPRVKQIAR
jgi:hypothetical protein